MKHIKDAKNLLEKNDGAGAYAIIENILDIAPKNPEALHLKAKLFERWGRFEESFGMYKELARRKYDTDEFYLDWETAVNEEHEVLIFSKLTPEGRYYFSFPKSQAYISLYGFLGCTIFLGFGSNLLNDSSSLGKLLVAFFLLVLVPWIMLIVLHLSGIKKILVNFEGITVFKRFKSMKYAWQNLSYAVIQYDPNLENDYLKLMLYPKVKNSVPTMTFDISYTSSIVKARRHFVKNILSYADIICYHAIKKENIDPYPLNSDPNLPEQQTIKPQEDQNTAA